MKSNIDIAQICENGHVANELYNHFPEYRKDYCDRCGAKTIKECPSCDKPIQGNEFGGWVRYRLPNYCIHCGNPFPWTEQRKRSALDLAQEFDISPDDFATLTDSLDQLTKDTPQTQVAAVRFKKIMEKLGNGAASAVRDIIVDVLSETAKKLLYP